MKTFVLFIFLTTANAMALTTIRHPFSIEMQIGSMSVKEFNKFVSEEDQIPEYLEVSSNERDNEADQRASSIIATFDDLVEKMAKKGNKKFQYASLQLGVIPTALDTANSSTCYTGNIDNVAETSSKLLGYQFTEQLIVYAVRYKDFIDIADDPEGEYEKMIKNKSKAWNNFDTQSDSVLMIGSYSDSGEDIHDMKIIKCK